MKCIVLLSLFGSSYLTGATKAQNDLPKVIEELTKANIGETIILDFKGVEHVSASFWNGIIPTVYAFAADEEREIFPIVCNVREDSLEELEIALKNRGMAILVAKKEADCLSELKLIGVIDDAHKETFDLINSYGEVGAGDLVSAKKKESVGLTGWSNRLSTLYHMRLIRRSKQGRSFRYKPVIEV